MGFFDKLGGGLKKTRGHFLQALSGMFQGRHKADEAFFEELEELLITCDVGAQTSARICEMLRARVKEEKAYEPQEIKNFLREILTELAAADTALHLDTKPSVLLVIGVNGVGKTTSIGKLAAQLKAAGRQVILGAADTFRAAAIDQLEVWAQRAGVELVRGKEGADPASVIYDTIAAARARGKDVLICDTAGRLHNKKNLMDELAKIARVIRRELPDAAVETLLVLDATTGQNALNQAREFQQCTQLTGIILTKLDGTARGGVVLAIKETLGIPVKFIGVGEGVDDLQPFDADGFTRALLGEEA